MSDPSTDAVTFYVETRLRTALDNGEAVDHFGAMLKVAIQRGDQPREAIRKALAHWCLEALNIDVTEDRP